MKKSLFAVCLSLLLLGSACNQEPEKTPEPAETTESPSPTPTPKPAFDLEGVVIEASGSADAQASSPSPGGTSTSSPTAASSPTGAGTPATGDTSSPAATDAGPEGALIAIQQAAPGSIALKVSTYSSPDGSCDFGEGDTVVVAYTRVTTFEPPEVLSNAKFPNNLAKTKISVRGDILDPADNCLLVATSVTALEEVPTASPSPTKRAVRATPTRRPSPRPSPSPSPSPSPTPPTTPPPTTPPPTTPPADPPTTPPT